MITDVTPKEEKQLRKGICPDCGNEGFVPGPGGGASENFRCYRCEAEFNLRWPFSPERINYERINYEITPEKALRKLSDDIGRVQGQLGTHKYYTPEQLDRIGKTLETLEGQKLFNDIMSKYIKEKSCQ